MYYCILVAISPLGSIAKLLYLVFYHLPYQLPVSVLKQKQCQAVCSYAKVKKKKKPVTRGGGGCPN